MATLEGKHTSKNYKKQISAAQTAADEGTESDSQDKPMEISQLDTATHHANHCLAQLGLLELVGNSNDEDANLGRDIKSPISRLIVEEFSYGYCCMINDKCADLACTPDNITGMRKLF